MDTEKRIIKGIKFFRLIVGDRYESKQVEKYLPTFIELLEDYFALKKRTPEKENSEFMQDLFNSQGQA